MADQPITVVNFNGNRRLHVSIASEGVAWNVGSPRCEHDQAHCDRSGPAMSDVALDGDLALQMMEATQALYRAAVALEGVESDGHTQDGMRCPFVSRDPTSATTGGTNCGCASAIAPEREVFDHVADDLNILVVHGPWAALTLRECLQLSSEPEVEGRIQEVIGLLDGTVSEIRRIAFDLGTPES